jgi:septal ring factor EnvC (AmiA/AmiB activator)
MLSHATERILGWITGKIPGGLLSKALIIKYFPALLIFVLVSISTKGTNSIIGEYAKRLWFGYVHRFDIKKNKVARKEARETIEKTETELEALLPELSALMKALEDKQKDCDTVNEKYDALARDYNALKEKFDTLEAKYNSLLADHAKLTQEARKKLWLTLRKKAA